MEIPKNESKKDEVKRQKRARKSKEEVEENKDAPTEEKKPKGKTRPPRNDEWKAELERTMDVNTKIPPMPKESDMIKEPNSDMLNANIEKISSKIEAAYKEADTLKEQQKNLRESIYAQNNAEFVELKALNQKRSELSNKIKFNKTEKEALQKKVDELQTKKMKLEKKGGTSKTMSKTDLEELIAEKERDFKNSLKTATTEKKYLEEISRLKASLPLSDDVNKLEVQMKDLREKMKEFGKLNKEIGAQLDVLKAQGDSIKSKLNLPEKKPEKTEEEKKEEKPKRELTAEEKALKAKRDTVLDSVTKLKEQKKELRDKHYAQMDAYYKQKEEIYRINFMTGIMKRLKREENQKKWKEEQAKRDEEKLERIRNAASMKFQADIELCEHMTGVLKQMMMMDQMQKNNATTEIKKGFNMDDKLLKDENLAYMKPKNDQDEGVQPGQKRKGKKQNKKQPVAAQPEKPAFELDLEVIQYFSKMSIVPPKCLEDLDSAISSINGKKEEFVKIRDEAVAKAQLKKETVTEEKVEEEKPEEEEKAKPEESKKAKDIKFDDNMFPTLG